MNKMEIPSLSTREYRMFGLTFAAIIAVLFGVFFPWVFNASSLPTIPWVIAAIFVIWALLAPDQLVFVYKPWMRFAHVLAYINTRLILGLIYFLIFTPVSLLFSLFRVDLLDRKAFDSRTPSFWKQCKQSDRKDMENLY